MYNEWRLLCLRKIIYHLNSTESYTVNLHHRDLIIERYQHSMSKDTACESLLLQNYSSLILTIECIGVRIYHTDSGSYMIFDSLSYMFAIRSTIHSELSTLFPDYTDSVAIINS